MIISRVEAPRPWFLTDGVHDLTIIKIKKKSVPQQPYRCGKVSYNLIIVTTKMSSYAVDRNLELDISASRRCYHPKI